MNNPKGIPPNEVVRQQIFHMLKRISSYTAWKRLLGYYQKWVDATEASFKQASAQGWEEKTSLPYSDYVGLLNGMAHFDEGVRRLSKGDKRVFKYNAHGEFVMALRLPLHWNRFLNYMESGDVGINEAYTPLWPEFVRTKLEMDAAFFECVPDILEKQWLDAYSFTFYNDWLEKDLAKMTFPSPLPKVPDPIENILIPSGKTIPCTGIWEPVVAPPLDKGVWSLFKKNPPPVGPFPIDGTMAYLHGGSHAPNKHDHADTELGVPCTWRLLWEDKRYEDGVIPDEEKDYVFRLPEAPAKPQAALLPQSAESLVMLESGKKTPVAGRWLLEGDLHVSLELEKNAELPLHQGQSVRWVLAVA